MPDYTLEHLNTRSFEQLVQALGLEIIGKQLMLFGDGPDGGREAFFDGVVKYPEGKVPWSGCGMMQAKFRQHPDSIAKRNADWAIRELKAEFKKLKKRPANPTTPDPGERICPEFYVFATNLVLSPVAKKGGKDRVRAVMDGFKKSHGLKDYAIWDRDQIRGFLDNLPAVRSTYAAWILPGDVLAEMMRTLSLDTTDFPSTVRRYLESELLDDQYAKLGQGGYTDANAIPLSKVFVDLPVDLPSQKSPQFEFRGDDERDRNQRRKHPPRPTFLDIFLEEGRQVLKPSANVNLPAPGSQAPPAPGRIVLIGGPGQGKTTVGQFACQLHRAAILRKSVGNKSPEVAQALLRIEQQANDLPTVDALRYPLRVDLKQLAEALAGEGDLPSRTLLDYLIGHISNRTASEVKRNEFRNWLRAYPWLLVLDGLDEVPASSNRTKMIDAIRDFISIEAHQQDADLLILATTRPQGYSNEFDPGLYRHVALAPLNASEACIYGTKLAEARHPGLESRIAQLTKSLQRATTNAATVRLMESPLQVTIMLALIEGGGEPPEQRWKLFHDYYDVIFRREKERGTPFSALLGKYEPDIHWLHHRAGWTLQQKNAATGETAARLSHSDFEQMVDARLSQRGHKDASKRNDLVVAIRKAATDRLVFLVGNTAKEIGFEIRSLQEFMAAEHFFDGPEACVQETVRAIAPHPYWRNVFLFAAGRIFFEKEILVDSLIVVCERFNDTPADAANRIIKAGSRLAVAMLKDGVSRNQPENSRVLSRCAAQILDCHDTRAASQCVSFFAGEGHDVWEEELSVRLKNHSEDSFPYAGWWLCIELCRHQSEFAISLLKNSFPWRNPHITRLLKQVLSTSDPVAGKVFELIKEQLIVVSPTVWREYARRDRDKQRAKADLLGQLLRILNQPPKPDGATLIDEMGKPTCNGLNVRGTECIDAWAALKIPEIPSEEMHPHWRACHAISEFAREYSPVGLVKQLPFLDLIAALIGRDAFEYEIPWQICACILSKKDGVSVDQIASVVSSGALGSAADWVRWNEEGIEQILLSDFDPAKPLLSASDTNRAAIYEFSGWSSRGHSLQENVEFAVSLSESLWRLRPKSRLCALLISLCSFSLDRNSDSWTQEEATLVTNFVAECNKLEIPICRQLVWAVLRSSLQTRVKTDILGAIESVGGRSWIHSIDADNNQIDSVCREIFCSGENTDNLQRALAPVSFLPPLPFLKTLPSSLLEGLRNRGRSQADAVVALQHNSLEWDKSADEVVAELLNLRESYPEHLSELLEAIDTEGAAGAHLEALVIALMKVPEPELEFHFVDLLPRLLLTLVERRPAISSLLDPTLPK